MSTTKLKELHLAIADTLTDCARKKTTICYSALCDRLGYPGLRTIGRELEKVSLLTYEKYGVFLSVLVVMKDTYNTDNPMPGTGFFTMYLAKCGGKTTDLGRIAVEQRNKAYAQDWSNFAEDLRSLIRAQQKTT